jgi:hypothetical protein
MVFDKLRSKITGRAEYNPPSAEAIRAHVLGEAHALGTPPFPPSPVSRFSSAPSAPKGRYGAEFEGEMPVSSEHVERLQPPSIEDFPQHEMPAEPPPEFHKRLEERGVYELMDRLSVIEAQLSAIRAQTETLNERMKTIEMYVRGRMPRTTF